MTNSVPAFPDAGRVTVGGIHYSLQDGVPVPVAETEFACDNTFGYSHSALAEYVEERTGGRVSSDQVLRVDLDALRIGGPSEVAGILSSAKDGKYVVVDATQEDDLRVMALAAAAAGSNGSHFLYRVGPPFVRALIGQEPSPPLTEADCGLEQTAVAPGGLIVVGSHVDLTTRQLGHLLNQHPNTHVVELNPQRLTSQQQQEGFLRETADEIAAALERGNVVLHTSREVLAGASGEESLAIARSVSGLLVGTVREIVWRIKPRFVIAKGGITSSDVAITGLGITRAMVRGPLLPGLVSLWEPADGPARSIPYVVFAGNVGDETSLTAVVNKLSKGRNL